MVAKNKKIVDLLNFALENITQQELAFLSKQWLTLDLNAKAVDASNVVPYKQLITLSTDDANHNRLQVVEINNTDYLLFIAPTTLGTEEQNYLALLIPTVAKINQGGEFMEDDKLERLEAIAKRTWQRNLSDRVGLSPLEEMFLLNDDDECLPVKEQLLADKTSHIIKREYAVEYAPHLGINVEVPEHKASLGELYNLKVGRGTLNS